MSILDRYPLTRPILFGGLSMFGLTTVLGVIFYFTGTLPAIGLAFALGASLASGYAIAGIVLGLAALVIGAVVGLLIDYFINTPSTSAPEIRPEDSELISGLNSTIPYRTYRSRSLDQGDTNADTLETRLAAAQASTPNTAPPLLDKKADSENASESEHDKSSSEKTYGEVTSSADEAPASPKPSKESPPDGKPNPNKVLVEMRRRAAREALANSDSSTPITDTPEIPPAAAP